MNNTIIGTQLLDESEMSALSSGLLSLEESLKVIATDGSLLPIFEVAFANEFDREKAEDLRGKWEVENLEWLPKIDIRSAAEINGANGAFAGANNTIYLTTEYLSQNVGNGAAIANLLLEEVGHFVDYEINQVDTSGDEGDIFAHLVQGLELKE
ncbi:polysaccharide deacetylase, partial [Okeania hirsuta]